MYGEALSPMPECSEVVDIQQIRARWPSTAVNMAKWSPFTHRTVNIASPTGYTMTTHVPQIILIFWALTQLPNLLPWHVNNFVIHDACSMYKLSLSLSLSLSHHLRSLGWRLSKSPWYSPILSWSSFLVPWSWLRRGDAQWLPPRLWRGVDERLSWVFRKLC